MVHPDTGRSESNEERVDRNLLELLNELRVALPGVQVLFAFLLVVPFNQRFADVTTFQKNTYFVTLLFSAAGALLLIAPSIHHRIEFRRQDKEHIVLVSNKLSIAGLTCVAIAMTGVIMVLTDFLFGSTTTIVVTAAVAIAFVLFWYAIPIARLRKR